jgi:hypothetical protein
LLRGWKNATTAHTDFSDELGIRLSLVKWAGQQFSWTPRSNLEGATRSTVLHLLIHILPKFWKLSHLRLNVHADCSAARSFIWSKHRIEAICGPRTADADRLCNRTSNFLDRSRGRFLPCRFAMPRAFSQTPILLFLKLLLFVALLSRTTKSTASHPYPRPTS